MPIYEYQGKQFDISTTDPVEAKQKILAYLGKSFVPSTPEARPEGSYKKFNRLGGNIPFTSEEAAAAAESEDMYRSGEMQYEKADIEKARKLLKAQGQDTSVLPDTSKTYPKTQVIQQRPTNAQPTKPKDSSIVGKIAGEALAAGEVVLGAPEFVFNALGTGLNAAGQVIGQTAGAIATGDTSPFGFDLNKIRGEVANKSDSLSIGKLKAPIEMFAKFAGVEEDVKNSYVNKAMGSITEGIDFVATKAEEKYGIPKAATVSIADIGMLGVGVPGIKPLVRNTKRVFGEAKTALQAKKAPNSITSESITRTGIEEVRPVPLNQDNYVRDTTQVPTFEVDPKSFSDALYKLDSNPKADIRDAIKARQALDDIGISLDLQEKFRRYDEGQAEGNAFINLEISRINKEINEIYSENAGYFEGKDIKTSSNPNGTIPWQKFEFKAQVAENYKRIEKLNKQKADAEARRGTKEELTTREKEIYQKYYEPVKTEIQRLTEYLEKEGIVEQYGKDTAFASRKSLTPKKETGVFKSYLEAIVGKDYTEARTEGNVADAGLSRKYFTLEDPTGRRDVVSIAPAKDGTIAVNEIKLRDVIGVSKPKTIKENGIKDQVITVTYRDSKGKETINDISKATSPAIYKKVSEWDGKSRLNIPTLKNIASGIPPDLIPKTGDSFLGRKVREASVEELELNTGTSYSKDYNLVMGERLANLREMVRNNEFAKDIRAQAEAGNSSIVFKPKSAYQKIPEGFRQLQFTDKMPQLRDLYFENRYAEMLDDFNKPADKSAIGKINNALVTNMMLVPIAHMHNEAFHYAVTRGASGFLNPIRMKDMAVTLASATKEVWTRGDLYKQILREGGSTMSANIRNSRYLEKTFEASLGQMAKTKGFKEMAKKLGRSPADLYSGISKASNTAMWSVRDVLYTALIKEKMKQGKTLKEAIDSTERHMPNYRLPSRLLTDAKIGRDINKFLGNRKLFLFARYHAGMLASAKNTLRDIAMLDPKEKKSKQFKEGIDSALAAGIAMSVVYPLLDDIASVVSDTISSVFGDGAGVAKAKVRRAGVSHVFDTMAEVYKGEKDLYSLSSIIMTPSPVFATAFELVMNKELYNSKPITNFKNDPDIMADQVAQYLLRKVPQASQAMQASNEDYGTGLAGIILRNFFDIKTQTGDQLDRIEDQVQRRESEAEDTNDEYQGMFFRRN